MKVLDLRCANGHGFEGWFGSDDDFMQQNDSGLLQCPVCSDDVVTRMPSAPRLNLSGAREPQAPAGRQADGHRSVAPAAGSRSSVPSGSQRSSGPAGALAPSGPPAAVSSSGHPVPGEMQAAWLHAVRELMSRTEDVGASFAEEARRIHYGECAARAIRGQATAEDRAALQEEGIETVSIAVPAALSGPLQ